MSRLTQTSTVILVSLGVILLTGSGCSDGNPVGTQPTIEGQALVSSQSIDLLGGDTDLSEVGTGRLVWSEDFEQYAAGSFPSTWTPDANGNAAASCIVNDVYYDGAQSLRLFGVIGACWGALAYHPLNVSPPFEIELAVRNGDEVLSGCHPDRAYVGLRQGTSWVNPSRPLISFMGDGTIRSGNGTLDLGSYSLLAWNKIRIRYERPNDSDVRVTYWINGKYRGSEVTVANSAEDQLTNLDLTVQEGSAWFDAISILSKRESADGGGPIIVEKDFTGDGTLDIRADNGLMWIQINRDEVEQAGKFIDAGGISGNENFLRSFIQAGGLVDRVSYWYTRDFDVTILENNAQTGMYRVTAVDTANGKEVTKVFTVRLDAGQENALIDYVFTNTGNAVWIYDHPFSHIHDGAALANVTSSERYDIDAYINGVGRINLSSLGWWRSYAPNVAAPFAVLFEPTSGEAVTFGYDGNSEYPLNQIVAYYTGATSDITPTLDFQASEFTLEPGASTGWRALIAFHSGGDAKGIEIYNAATW